LDLSGNKLIDGVPLSLYNQRLEVLKVGGNVDVTGTIPSIISNMTSLRVFDVGQTKFGGPIPTGIYSLPNITTLDLGQAAFTGGISELIGKTNKTLVDLFLDGNLLTGPLPAAFSALGKLENLFLANNSLTGSIPETGLCERRGLGGGNLQQITRDCNIVCGCCPEKCVD
jgi:Leucine-rich repeat (LRR) protein